MKRYDYNTIFPNHFLRGSHGKLYGRSDSAFRLHSRRRANTERGKGRPLYATTNNIYSLWLTRAAVEQHGICFLDSDILFEPDIIRLCLHEGHDNCLVLKSGMTPGAEEIKMRTDARAGVREIGMEIDTLEDLEPAR